MKQLGVKCQIVVRIVGIVRIVVEVTPPTLFRGHTRFTPTSSLLFTLLSVHLVQVQRLIMAQSRSIKQAVSQAVFSQQHGRRQSTAATQVNRFIQLKQEQLANVNRDTSHPLLRDTPVK